MSSSLKFDILDRREYDRVFDFMQQTFRVQEPITDALGTTANDSYIFYKDLCSTGFQTIGTSLSVKNSDGELVAIALNSIYNYKNLPRVLATEKTDFTKDIDAGPYPTRNGNRLIVFIEHVEAGLFARLTPEARVFKCDILCTRKDYCRMGIGTELLAKSIELARQFRCSHVATCATARASQRLFERQGFRVIREIEFSKFFDKTEPVFEGVFDNGRSAKLMLLDLKK